MSIYNSFNIYSLRGLGNVSEIESRLRNYNAGNLRFHLEDKLTINTNDKSCSNVVNIKTYCTEPLNFEIVYHSSSESQDIIDLVILESASSETFMALNRFGIDSFTNVLKAAFKADMLELITDDHRETAEIRASLKREILDIK